MSAFLIVYVVNTDLHLIHQHEVKLSEKPAYFVPPCVRHFDSLLIIVSQVPMPYQILFRMLRLLTAAAGVIVELAADQKKVVCLQLDQKNLSKRSPGSNHLTEKICSGVVSHQIVIVTIVMLSIQAGEQCGSPGARGVCVWNPGVNSSLLHRVLAHVLHT